MVTPLEKTKTEVKHEIAEVLQGRVEDHRFLVGEGKYVDDMKPANIGYLGIVRSNYAHARIKNIDLSKVKDDPDFIDAITGQDLVKMGVGPIAELPLPGSKITNRLHLAVEKVRYVGEPVVAFVARRKYSVEDIAENIDVECDPLPVVTTIEESRNGKALLYEEWGNNKLLEVSAKKGEVGSASTYTVKEKFGIKRQAGAPIEPRVAIASYDRDSGVYHIFATVQGAHRLKGYLTSELKVPPEKIHVTVPDVGGGFGVKGAQSYCEYMLACILAKKTGLAIKWTSTRTEDMLETAQGRDEYCDIELSCDSDAKLTALRASIVADGGAGGSLKGQPALSVRLLPGAYKVPNLEITGALLATNKTMSGPLRGAGRPEASFFIELAMDKLARRLKIDPFEFRMRNVIRPSEFPYDNGAGAIYDSADLPKLMEMLRNDYEKAVQWKQKFNQSGDKGRRAGVGLALVIEDTGAQFAESAKVVAALEEKKIHVFTGSSPHGQGHETSWAILASEELGVPMDQISVIWGDTDNLKSTVGTFGSRSAVTGGSAVVAACRNLKEQLIRDAAELFLIDPSQVEYRNGAIFRRDTGELVSGLWKFIEKLGKDVSVSADFTARGLTYASSAHLCALIVDMETGKLQIEKYVAVDDCGRVINEMIVDGQLHGGIAHGIGGSILEQIEYDEDGTPLAQNFMDYTIATALDIPDLVLMHMETPSTISLNGAKGVGESGTIGAYPVIFNALNDALDGVGEVNIAPATPDRVMRAISPHLFSV
ncbi:MAG: xanthine dehydrogenase family protein molybdopterin-binding subunit [Nitrososphaerales archaeon]